MQYYEPKIKKFKIKFITPVFIGDGEEIEPFNYILEDNTFYRINLEKFIFDLDDIQKNKLISLIDNSNVIELRKFIKDNCDVENYNFYKAKASIDFKNEYEKNLNSLDNKLIVNSFIKTGNYIPYIPGSSIKGAIRTAILNNLYDSRKKKENLTDSDIVNKVRTKISKIESFILEMKNSDAKNDPFRFLSISDYFLNNNELVIARVTNMRLNNKSSGQKSWQMFYETPLNLKDKDDFIPGEIKINTEIPNKANIKFEFGDFDFIKQSCDSFYQKIAEDEYDKFYTNNHDISSKVDKKYSEIRNIGANEILLRVGKNSHFESLTLKDFNWLKPKKRGNSRNLFDGKWPMGWIKLIFI
jgi:CRISPR-associated protein Csm5